MSLPGSKLIQELEKIKQNLMISDYSPSQKKVMADAITEAQNAIKGKR